MTSTRRLVTLREPAPSGSLLERHLGLIAETVRDLRAEEVLIRPVALSVDPLMRGRMRGIDTFFLPQFEPGRPLVSDAVGYVLRSNDPAFTPGQLVHGWLEWADIAVWSPNNPLSQLFPLEVINDVGRPSHWLGVFGINGLTAYFGVREVAQPQSGETMLVSAAAGGVGSLVGQIARRAGTRVIGLCGGPRKVKSVVDELGYEAALDYHRPDLADALRGLLPNGPDIYFDNVGGELSQLIMSQMHRPARVVECGQVATYGDPDGGWRIDVRPIHSNGLRLDGFHPALFIEKFPQALADLRRWVDAGEIVALETVYEGLERAPAALVGVLNGANLGKMIVQLSA